ncbi:hypothetical protein PLESTF_001766000 [Pleodorina starrii]|nr:hypothetical protein PLESTF_001766000 [Pleodorina starrii]
MPTTLVSLNLPLFTRAVAADRHLESGPINNRFLRSSMKAAWDSQQAEEEMELEEFRALETQIKADVVGGARARSDQGAQALPSSSTLLPSAPMRSYAAIHQHRPPQPGHGAPRSTAAGPVRPHAGWASPQAASRHRYNDAFGAADADADDDEYGGGFGNPCSDPPGGDDGAAAAAWGQQQLSPGKPASAAGGRAKGGAGFGSAAGAAAWGLDGADGGAPGTAKSGGASGFDDADAWNDTSSFFGGGGAGAGGTGASVRKGAAAAATGGGRQAQARGSAFFGGHRKSPGAAGQLDDPWAAPVGGDDAYGAGRETLPDDCSGWSADQQQKLQPQQAGLKGGDDDRGPDQPFVRALFNKQQQRQPSQGSAGRALGKGAPGGGGKGKVAEPQGPSAAELERMQALEEQMANVASERSTLVRMRTELEKAANRLEQERQAWEKSRAEEQTKWEAQRDAEEAKLRRDRRVLEKQSKALLKLPNKKERTAMEAAEAALEAERREGRAREARHKLTVERLRRQLVELQERNHELREEVRWHEAQQLERGWGGTGAAAAAGGGSAKGGGAGSQPQLKPRPSRAIAVQTEPLAFLPPLEGAGTGAAGAQDAAAGGAAASSAFGGPRHEDGREGTAAAPTTSGGRPKSAGPFKQAGGGGSSSGGSGPGGGGRLRGLQASSRGAAAAVGASQPALPTTWRAQRATLRKSSGTAQWQASAWGAQGEDGPEEGYGEEAGPAYYGQDSLHPQQMEQHRQRQQRLGAQPDSPVSWQQGRQQAYDMDGEYGMERGDEDAPEDEAEGAEELQAEGYQGAARREGRGGGFGGDDAFGRVRGGGGAPGAASPSSYSYVQNDDLEVLTDEGGAADGMDPGSPSTLAWQQHQEFMAKMGLGHEEGGRHQSQARPGGQSQQAFAAGEMRQQAQRQPPQQQQPWGRSAGGPNEEGCGGAQRPSTSGRASRQQQLQQQQQEGPAFGMGAQPWRQGGTGTARPASQHSQEGQAPVRQAYPGQDPAAGPGPGGGQFSQKSCPTFPSCGSTGPGRVGAGAEQGGMAAASAFFATGDRSFSFNPSTNPGEHPMGAAFPVAAAAAAGQGPACKAPGQAGPGHWQGQPAVGVQDSFAELDGVSETLASLRMDRHVEAAAAATRGGGAGGLGPQAFAPPGSARAPPFSGDPAAAAQRGGADGAPHRPGLGTAAERARDGGGWTANGWSAAGFGGPARDNNTLNPQQAPHARAAVESLGGWGGQPQHFQQHQQQQQQHAAHQPALDLQGQGQQRPQPQWPNSTMGATAAGAASVAHTISTQQHQQHFIGGHAHSRPAGSQPASIAGGSSGGGSGHESGGGGDALVREVRHADGKTERLYATGTRLVLFANGTRKVALPDGSSRVYFANGDIKWAIPAAAVAAAAARDPSCSAPPPPSDVGVVHYYYAEVATWHSTYGGDGGVEVFYFPSGQTEAHHPGHGKEILFPDGVLRVVTVDGEEVDVSWQQLSWAVQQPQPRVEDLGDDDL